MDRPKKYLVKDLKQKPMETARKNKVKVCKSFECFTELMGDARDLRATVFINGKKRDGRRTNLDDFEDMFDNGVQVKYQHIDKSLHITTR